MRNTLLTLSLAVSALVACGAPEPTDSATLASRPVVVRPMPRLVQISFRQVCARGTAGITVSFPTAYGHPVVHNDGSGLTVEIPGPSGMVVSIPGNPPIDLSETGPETTVSFPGGPETGSGGGVISLPEPSGGQISFPENTTVTFPTGGGATRPTVRVTCRFVPTAPVVR